MCISVNVFFMYIYYGFFYSLNVVNNALVSWYFLQLYVMEKIWVKSYLPGALSYFLMVNVSRGDRYCSPAIATALMNSGDISIPPN